MKIVRMPERRYSTSEDRQRAAELDILSRGHECPHGSRTRMCSECEGWKLNAVTGTCDRVGPFTLAAVARMLKQPKGEEREL